MSRPGAPPAGGASLRDSAAVLGLDIGGANLKAATANGRAWCEPFEIWRAPEQLAARLAGLIDQAAPCDALAVTMTAELADCFATKAEGVARILDAVAVAARGRRVSVWSLEGEFLPLAAARGAPALVAAANWHALATWVARRMSHQQPNAGTLLLDVGSTTTDCIPLRGSAVCSQGRTDLERMLLGELVYTGARRTPLCAVEPVAWFRQARVPLAAEWFATMLDAYLLAGLVEEDAQDCGTADGRPATVACAHNRLAHCLCCDATELPLAEARGLARQFVAAQQRLLASAISAVWSRQPAPCASVVVCGSGEFVARRVAAGHPATRQARIVSVGELAFSPVAAAACAFALACLAGQP